MNLKDKLNQTKQWVIQQVIWAEKELKDKSGAERKAAVVRKIDDMLILPWWAEWADEFVIGYLVDLVCEKLNMFTTREIGQVEGLETEKLVAIVDAPITEVAKSAAKPESVDDRLNELYRQYGIKPDVPTIEPLKAEPIKRAAPPQPQKEDEFERAIAFSLKWEGGRNFDIIGGIPVIKGKNVNDRGGLTAYGITNSTLKYAHAAGVVPHDDIAKLTQEEAKRIYRKNFWERYGWGELPWPVSLCCLDCSINHGGFAWILQRALVSVGHKVAVDGKFGNQTRGALIRAAQGDVQKLAVAICDCRKLYYDGIITRDPKQAVFKKGWYKRVDDLRKVCGL